MQSKRTRSYQLKNNNIFVFFVRNWLSYFIVHPVSSESIRIHDIMGHLLFFCVTGKIDTQRRSIVISV